MSSLSKQAETKLIGAIEAAASLVNSGMNPNAAIIKSATDAGIPPGHIDLMVHAYNTGRTTKQREQGESTIEKAADFALANVDEIRSALFGSNVKTSAEIMTQQVVSPEYAISPEAAIKRAQKAHERPTYRFTPEFVAPPRDEHAEAQRAYSQKRAAQLAEEEQRRQVTESYNKTAAKLDELVTYFRTPGHLPFPDAMKDIQIVHGEDGVRVLQKVANLYPPVEKEVEKNIRIVSDTTARDLVGDVLSTLDNYTKISRAYDKKKAATARVTEKKAEPTIVTGSILVRPENEPLTLKEAKTPSYSFVPVIPQPEASKPVTQKPSKGGGGSSVSLNERVTNAVSPISWVAGRMGLSDDKPTGGDPNAKKRDQYNQLSDPEFDSTIKNIRAKSVLHDLVLNDPIISGHDPQDVAMAFNDIAELAPNLVDTPGMLQTVLRKRLEAGQLADFDVKQILEMDKLRAERDKIQGEARRVNIENM